MAMALCTDVVIELRFEVAFLCEALLNFHQKFHQLSCSSSTVFIPVEIIGYDESPCSTFFKIYKVFFIQ